MKITIEYQQTLRPRIYECSKLYDAMKFAEYWGIDGITYFTGKIAYINI